jgi:multidrug efflux pump subunit AcrA (membrane-fusion protein)
MVRSRLIPIFVNLLVVAGVVAAWWAGWIPGLEQLMSQRKESVAASREPSSSAPTTAMRMRAVKPRRDAKTQVSVTQPAEVRAYYTVQLFADRAGTVSMLEKDMGDDVSEGEVVIEIRESGTNASYRIASPFDGVISSRSVDPGTFVPSAAIVPNASPLLTIARTDIVTISMNVPDTFVPFVTPNVQVAIRNPTAVNQPPIETRLSRISPMVRSSDRTLKVEVDLFNEIRQDYDELIAEEKPKEFASFKSRKPPEFPLNLTNQQAAELVPGMLYEMQLTMKEFANVPMIPSSSIVRRSGKTYVYVIVEGKLVEVPVAVQLDDGTTAYVRKVRRSDQGVVEEDWVGDELIAWGTAGDLQAGKLVDASQADW